MAPILWILLIPGLASAQPAEVEGTVKDASGLAVEGAFVTLETSAATIPRTVITDQAGLFRFVAVEPGDYKITIAALGFEAWTAAISAGENKPSLSAVLKVAATSNSVNVTLPPHELAAEQLKAEEKQRLLGVFPDFFVSYAPDAAPLTAAQKFQLGWKTITDPVAFISSGVAAGIQQGRNNYPEFGQGVEGYAKRFGAQYADRVSGIVIGDVVMQSIFHQDPRYFYKGTGSIRSRALYAIGTAFVRKGDNGHWQLDYSDVLGGIASHEISTLYYPSSSRPVRRLADDVMLGFAGRAAHNLLHEFVVRRLTTHAPAMVAGLSQRTLGEGTAVSLISVEDWNSKPAESGVPVAFLLAADLEVDGVIVAPIGSKVSGRATFGGDSGKRQVGLDHVSLKIGGMTVPLRKTPLRDGDAQLEYHRLENSGRIAITLYVGQSVTLPVL
ncbi:MAG: carboxypeptidase-like regulatory domain-containing protein [Bryobacteraceae bacterium]